MRRGLDTPRRRDGVRIAGDEEPVTPVCRTGTFSARTKLFSQLCPGNPSPRYSAAR